MARRRCAKREFTSEGNLLPNRGQLPGHTKLWLSRRRVLLEGISLFGRYSTRSVDRHVPAAICARRVLERCTRVAFLIAFMKRPFVALRTAARTSLLQNPRISVTLLQSLPSHQQPYLPTHSTSFFTLRIPISPSSNRRSGLNC